MTNAEADRNIRLYSLNVVFSESLFFGVLFVSYLTDLARMSLAEIFYMHACMLAIGTLLEIPSGIFSDRIGRVRTIRIARVVHLIGSIWIIFMSSATDAWVVCALLAVASAIQNGADTSLLYETLKEKERTHEFEPIFARAQSWRLWTRAITALLLGFLASVDLRLPLVLGLPCTLIALYCAFRAIEPPRRKKESTSGASETPTQTFTVKGRLSALWWAILFSVLFSVTSKFWYWHNQYFVMIELPLIWFGVAGCALNLAAGFGSYAVGWIRRICGTKRMVLVVVLALSLPGIIMGIFPGPLSALGLLVQTAAVWGVVPFIQNFINARVQRDDARNTILSVQTTIAGFASVSASFGFATAIDTWGLLPAVALFGTVVLILGLIGVWAHRKL